MKTVYLMILLAAATAYPQSEAPAISVRVDTILSGKFSCRAILPDGKKIWYAADQGRFGFFDFTDNTTFEKRIVFDSLKPDFRSIAQTSNSIFIINAGSPALLYRVDKESLKTKLVYRETHKNAFYDSMNFWNDLEGIAVGDPIDGCFSILITRDGGSSWQKSSCEKLPATAEGEAAFAASNTNIVIKGDHTWIVSGGKKARVFYSPDKGKTWEVHDTPIVQGATMTGIFTADFYDLTTGFIAGGDYEKPEAMSGNKAITSDGGTKWKLISENAGSGYTSCLQFVPGSQGKGIVSCGTSGLQYSDDGGNSWRKLLDDKTLYTIRFSEPSALFAAGRNKIIRIRLEK